VLAVGGIVLHTQDARYSPFDTPKRTFSLRPDIVLESGGRTVVIDTKWKLLSNKFSNFGISQSTCIRCKSMATTSYGVIKKARVQLAGSLFLETSGM